MSTLLELQPVAWQPPAAAPLDDVVWDAWMSKGATRDRRATASRMKAVKWVEIVVLLASAGLWFQVTPYELAIKSIVAAGALVVMFQAFQTRRFAFAGIFGLLAVLYNPLVSVFTFSDDWQRAIVAASAAPFIASLALREVRVARND